jgi:hypothetical protein
VPEQYDVAISFLADDEPTARALSERLAGQVSTFVYSERQKDLAGRDGVEKFSAVFRREARLVVVLYRDGWGSTKWTRIEETAIKDRHLDEGLGFLFVVAMQPRPTLPAWLPRTRLYFDLSQFGLDGAVAAIVARFQEAGGEPRDESSVEKAARLHRAAEHRKRQKEWLRSPAAAEAAERQFSSILEYLSSQIEAISKGGTPIDLHRAQEERNVYAIRAPAASLVFWWERDLGSGPIATLKMREFDGPVFLGPWAAMRPTPNEVATYEYVLELDEADNEGWRGSGTERRFYTSEQLAERHLKRIIDRNYARR